MSAAKIRGVRSFLRSFTASAVKEHIRSEIEATGGAPRLTEKELELVHFIRKGPFDWDALLEQSSGPEVLEPEHTSAGGRLRRLTVLRDESRTGADSIKLGQFLLIARRDQNGSHSRMPFADDAVEHERIVLGELLGGLAARADRHRAFAREIVLPRLAPVPIGEEPR
jgi:hypothetical protein